MIFFLTIRERLFPVNNFFTILNLVMKSTMLMQFMFVILTTYTRIVQYISKKEHPVCACINEIGVIVFMACWCLFGNISTSLRIVSFLSSLI